MTPSLRSSRHDPGLPSATALEASLPPTTYPAGSRVTLNRLIAILGPFVAPVAGTAAVWLQVHFPGLHLNANHTAEDITRTVLFCVAALISWALQHKYLAGAQQWERGVLDYASESLGTQSHAVDGSADQGYTNESSSSPPEDGVSESEDTGPATASYDDPVDDAMDYEPDGGTANDELDDDSWSEASYNPGVDDLAAEEWDDIGDAGDTEWQDSSSLPSGERWDAFSSNDS